MTTQTSTDTPSSGSILIGMAMAFIAGLIFGGILSADTLANHRADVIVLKQEQQKLEKLQKDTWEIVSDMLDRPWRWWDTKGKR